MPVQVVHVDDLASALALAATRDLPGVFNVAADGWLDAAEARELIPRSTVPAFPAEVLERVLAPHLGARARRRAPGVVPYLVHPWVIANDKLKAEGWAPVHANADAIREAVAALPPRDTRPVVVVAGASGARGRPASSSSVAAGVRPRPRSAAAASRRAARRRTELSSSSVL